MVLKRTLFQLRIRDVSIELSRSDVLMSQQFLNVANIDAVFEEMGGETVTQTVERRIAIHPTLCECIFEYLLSGSRRQFPSSFAFKNVRISGFPTDEILEIGNKLLREDAYPVFPTL